MDNPGSLYVVATPIGNYEDITLRAINVLKTVDAIICEEMREGSTLLHKLGIQNKELIPLNEHNEDTQAQEIIQRILLKGHSFALISDCGTPVFADPGCNLINQSVEFDISVIPIPGPSSLTTALSIVDQKIDKFIYSGFLSRDEKQRQTELRQLKNLNMTVILMDTPYRLVNLLKDVAKVFGAERNITLCCDLTLPTETILRGTVSHALNHLAKRKSEFVLIIHEYIVR
jgi:16S rRNA (cytidine1402-2'-O)-methyltransferase